jgi:preprotein translocase subunit SecE
VALLAKIKQNFGSTFSFFSDSWAELKKVKWPSRKELISYSLVVLGTTAFVTLYFYVLDLGISGLLRLVLGK